MTTIILIVAIGLVLLIYLAFVGRMLTAPKQLSQVVKLIEAGNTKQAIKGLKVMLSKNEHNPVAHWYLGEAYYREGRNELAVVECKFVLRINKFSPDVSEIMVHERLAALYEGFGQQEEAQKEYILLTKLNPDKAQYYYKVGEIFYKRSFTDKALAYFQNAVKLMPAHADALSHLGMIHYSKGQVREALDCFNKALHFNPQAHRVHYYLGLIQRSLGVFDKARGEFQLAQRDPDFKLRALLETGRVLLQIENVREATVELERALKFIKNEDEVSIEVRYVLGLCYEKARDLPKAIEQWETIEKHRKGYKDIGSKLGLYEDLRTDDTLKDFLTASREAFTEMCKKVISQMSCEVLEVFPVNDDAVDFLCSQQEGKWRNTKRSNIIVKIRRVTEPVTEGLLRQVQDEMKRYSANRGVIVSTSGFSPSATQYALTRPIDLIDRRQLSEYLHKIK